MSSADATSSNKDSSRKYKAVSFMVINNVLQLKADKAEVFSPTFTCAEDPFRTTFKMKYGFGKEVEGKLEVRVVPINCDVKLFEYNLRIFDDQMTVRRETKGVFSSGVRKVGCNHGWRNMFSLGDEGALRIMIDVTYEAEFSHYAAFGETMTTFKENALPPYLSAFSRDFLDLLNNPTHADVTVCVGDEKIKCHKVVLVARSSYFRGLFDSGMKESQTNTVTMTEISPQLFRQVLKFLYSAQLPDNIAETAFDLLPFAEKYVFEELKAACEDAIRLAVTPDNVIRAIVLADKHHCPNLFRHCVPIFKKNVNDLQKKEEWESLIEPDLLRRLLLSCCNEDAANKTNESGNAATAECARLGHAMQLSTDLGKMFGDKATAEGGCSDLVLILENDERINVHKAVLFATPGALRQVFMKNTDGAVATIRGPPSLVKEVIKFLYSGMPPENLESIAMELLPMAHMYGVVELRAMCDRALRCILTVDNLVDILILSEVNNCSGLFTFCLPLYKANASRLKVDSEEMLKKYPGLLLKIAKGGVE